MLYIEESRKSENIFPGYFENDKWSFMSNLTERDILGKECYFKEWLETASVSASMVMT